MKMTTSILMKLMRELVFDYDKTGPETLPHQIRLYFSIPKAMYNSRPPLKPKILDSINIFHGSRANQKVDSLGPGISESQRPTNKTRNQAHWD